MYLWSSADLGKSSVSFAWMLADCPTRSQIRENFSKNERYPIAPYFSQLLESFNLANPGDSILLEGKAERMPRLHLLSYSEIPQSEYHRLGQISGSGAAEPAA